jgi:hypothetical protein
MKTVELAAIDPPVQNVDITDFTYEPLPRSAFVTTPAPSAVAHDPAELVTSPVIAGKLEHGNIP